MNYWYTSQISLMDKAYCCRDMHGVKIMLEKKKSISQYMKFR